MIAMLYQISGQRKYYSTGIKVPELNWHHQKQQAVYSRKGDTLEYQIQKINADLAGLRLEVKEIEQRFELDRKHYTVNDVFERFLKTRGKGSKGSPRENVFDFVEKYITENASTRVKGSLTVYRSLSNYLKDFAPTITFDKINKSFFEAFKIHLVTNTELHNVSIQKILSTLKTFLNYARSMDIVIPDSYRAFKMERQDIEVITLTESELQAIISLNLSDKPYLDRVRDTFLFATGCGLRFSDIQSLKWENITDNEIVVNVQKTKDLQHVVPLNPLTRYVINKYKGSIHPVPVISSQKTNKYLKEVWKLAGIDEPLVIVRYKGSKRIEKIYKKYEKAGFHSSRRTFATLSLERGMKAQEVMKLTGHKSFKSFERYLNITEARKHSLMQQAWGGISVPHTHVSVNS